MRNTFQPSWLAQFDAHLFRNFGITIADSGQEPQELFAHWGHLDPQSAVWSYAIKYDLTPLESVY